MKRVVIDRFEGKYAVCEDDGLEVFSIPIDRLPEGAEEGCVLAISEEGELFLDLEETQSRRRRIAEKQRGIFEKQDEILP